MEREKRGQFDSEGRLDPDHSGRLPGKSTLVQQISEVAQNRDVEKETARNADRVHAAAQYGLSGVAGPLPHRDRIQALFGSHDVTGVRAHVGDVAAVGTAAMNAAAYTSNEQVAFASNPDLHMAAHEAAHVIQQRSGVQLEHGVGSPGDAYEREADLVADAVVRGDSAAALLAPYTDSTPSGTAVQMHKGTPEDPNKPAHLFEMLWGSSSTGSAGSSSTVSAGSSSRAVRPFMLVDGKRLYFTIRGAESSISLAQQRHNGAEVHVSIGTHHEGGLVRYQRINTGYLLSINILGDIRQGAAQIEREFMSLYEEEERRMANPGENHQDPARGYQDSNSKVEHEEKGETEKEQKTRSKGKEKEEAPDADKPECESDLPGDSASLAAQTDEMRNDRAQREEADATPLQFDDNLKVSSPSSRFTRIDVTGKNRFRRYDVTYKRVGAARRRYGFDLNHVKQGNLGTCGLLATVMAILATDPQKMDEAVQYDPQSGNARVTLYRDSSAALRGAAARGDLSVSVPPRMWIPVTINVNDALPYIGRDKLLADGHNEDHIERLGARTMDEDEHAGRWVAVLEKAYAVFAEKYGIHGEDDYAHAPFPKDGYSLIDEGSSQPQLLFRLFYGDQCTINRIDDIAGRSGLSKLLAMLVSFANSPKDSHVALIAAKNGQGFGHEYAIVDVTIVGGSERIEDLAPGTLGGNQSRVCVRDPHGENETMTLAGFLLGFANVGWCRRSSLAPSTSASGC